MIAEFMAGFGYALGASVAVGIAGVVWRVCWAVIEA